MRRVMPSRTPTGSHRLQAEREAGVGMPIEVLAELLDHRNLNITRRYYKSRELHQTGDKRAGRLIRVGVGWGPCR